jgi:diguanylate cyclase (GGDEF)-like protein
MPLALVVVDIDDFKQVNDAFTHVVGDEVLRRVAECLGRELRVGDHLTRYGGDEFIALLPRTGDQEARQVAQRMSDAIAALSWGELADGLSVRVSTGSAALWSLTGRRPDRDAESLFRQADEALLEAKRRRARDAAQAAWPVGGRRRRVAALDPADGAPSTPSGGVRSAPSTPPRGNGNAHVAVSGTRAGWSGEAMGPPTPVTAPVPVPLNAVGTKAAGAAGAGGDAPDVLPHGHGDDSVTDAASTPPQGPGSRRWRPHAVDLPGASTTRTPFG